MDTGSSQQQCAFWQATIACGEESTEPSHHIWPAEFSEGGKNVVAGVDEEGTVVREGDGHMEQDENQSRDCNRARRPYTPTKADWAEHLRLHLD